jgi:DNA-binding transcriptional ArsR family regulator
MMSLTETLKALSDPTRREILKVLRRRPLTVGEISGQIEGVSYASISKHLTTLKEAKLVDYTRVGTFLLYELNTTVFGDILTWLKDFEEEVQSVTSKENYFDIVVRGRN